MPHFSLWPASDFNLCVCVFAYFRHSRSHATPACPCCWVADSIHWPLRCPTWFDTTSAASRNAPTSSAAVSFDATTTHASPHDAQRAPARARGLWDASPPWDESPLPTSRSLRETGGHARKWGARRTRGEQRWEAV